MAHQIILLREELLQLGQPECPDTQNIRHGSIFQLGLTLHVEKSTCLGDFFQTGRASAFQDGTARDEAVWHTFLAGGIAAEVAVSTSTVPVPGDRLGIEGHVHVVQLSETQQDVPCHPQVIPTVSAHAGADLQSSERLSGGGREQAALQPQAAENLSASVTLSLLCICRCRRKAGDVTRDMPARGARAHLELPLGRHDLRIHTGDVDTSKVAALEVGLDDVTSNCGTSSG